MAPLLIEEAELEDVVEEFANTHSLSPLRMDDPANSRRALANATDALVDVEFNVHSRSGLGTPAPEASAVVLSPTGELVDELPLRIEEREVTMWGGQLVARDESGCLSLEIEADFQRRTGHLTVNWKSIPGTLPQTVMPAISFLRNFKPENLLVFLYQGEPLSPPQQIGKFWEPLPDALLDVITKLHYVQSATSTYFPIPDSFSTDDIANLLRAESLLRGEIAHGTWDRLTVSVKLHEGASMPGTESPPAAFMLDNPDVVEISGNSVPLGRTKRHLLSARVSSWETDPGDMRHGRLVLVPGETNEFESWLPAAREVEYIPVPGVSASFRDLFSEFMSENAEAMRRLAQ